MTRPNKGALLNMWFWGMVMGFCAGWMCHGKMHPPKVLTLDLGEFRVTAYCPSTDGSGCEWVSEEHGWRCCGKFADGKTSSGSDASIPGVAAPNDIPFGTILVIPGYGTCRVDDRGGSIKDKRLDVRFESHQEALNWGVQHLTIQQLEETTQ